MHLVHETLAGVVRLLATIDRPGDDHATTTLARSAPVTDRPPSGTRASEDS